MISRLLFLLFLFPQIGKSQSPEPQISFVKESRPHSYYIEQAQLWWGEIEGDESNEEAWYHYYRACRNAQGTANWSTDFVNEAPNLRLGDDIVQLMEEKIPDTFTYYFVSGSTGGVDPQAGEKLLKAYDMNPDFPGLLPTVVTYAVSTHDPTLRNEANERWYKNGAYPEAFYSFAYNLLSSIEPNGILLTQHDNDSYPVWLLQDALGIRTDVQVINIDFLLYGGFSDVIFEGLGIRPFRIEDVNVDDYEQNWTNVVSHLLNEYQGDRPLYVSQTVSPQWYQGFEDQMATSGLALKWKGDPEQLYPVNVILAEVQFMMDHLKMDFSSDPQIARLHEMNKSYLPMLYMLARGTHDPAVKPDYLKKKYVNLGRGILEKLEDEKLNEKYSLFDIE
jgi:hypothetical protein